MRRPNFFIVGAAKSGTTSMMNYLRAHPEISMPQRREPIYFGQDLNSHSQKTNNIDEYLRFFSNCGQEKIVGEKSVWYLYSKSAAAEIREFDEDAKILIILRNPIDMIYSLHQQFLSTGNENVKSFEEAIALVDQRAEGQFIPENAHFPDGLVYTRVPMYSEQVARYLETFPPDQVRIIIFDDLASKTESIYSHTLDFLGVDPGFAPDFAVHNKKMKPRSVAINRLARCLPKHIREPLSWRLARLNRVEDKRKPMSADMRASLAQLFSPEVERLSAILDRDLTHWCEVR